jgi:hypothetical protein
MKTTPATPSLIARELLNRLIAREPVQVELTPRGMESFGRMPNGRHGTTWILIWANNEANAKV